MKGIAWVMSKMKKENLFEMEKRRSITSYPKYSSWSWSYNDSSGGIELSSYVDSKHKHNKSSRHRLFISIALEFEAVLIVYMLAFIYE